MSLYKNLFKQTVIYGIATVLPRMLSFLLVRLHTDLMPTTAYGDVTIVLSLMVFFNVILSYGMETSFFRFYNKEEDKNKVIETTTISIFTTSMVFLALALLFRNTLANWANVETQYVTYAIWILVLDALSIIPFSKLRAFQRPVKYAVIKIGNVLINLGLNVFLLYFLPKIAQSNPESFWSGFYLDDFQVGYIFIANLIASLVTLLAFLPDYFSLKWRFDFALWKQLLQYGWPILFAGLAFGINEHFDKILLGNLLPESIAKAEVGAYAACYKIGLFMVLFRQAYTLGIEPFFFSHAGNENAPQTYATITKYFVIFGSLILLGVVVFSDVLKVILIGNSEYWEAMKVVPLIILANFFLGIYTSLSVWYKLIDKTKVGAYISVVGAIITLALNYLLIPEFSYMGSAIATLAAYGSMMFISYYLGNKYYPIPYDKKRIFGYLGLSTVLAGLSFYVDVFRENYIFGIAAILAFSYFIYYNEKETLLRILKRKTA
ncbi:polysaccharide biosynthesis C-terminal domain-containing protein [Flavobacterium enshiense]|uniref:lipopolysaccharide biosynthesis protein n=1 Tax=Flavobacterium enshiense TaxID=1341165 RepID=UPI00345D9451